MVSMSDTDTATDAGVSGCADFIGGGNGGAADPGVSIGADLTAAGTAAGGVNGITDCDPSTVTMLLVTDETAVAD